MSNSEWQIKRQQEQRTSQHAAATPNKPLLPLSHNVGLGGRLSHSPQIGRSWGLSEAPPTHGWQRVGSEPRV
eukprot:1864751-Prymnesium_polylepis.1